jgi:hypothetical protein
MRTLLLLAVLVAPLWGAPPSLDVPAEVTGQPGTFIAVRAKSDTAWVNFRASEGLAVFPADLLSDKKATVLTASAPGRYKLFCYTGNDDGGTDREIVVVIGNAPPVPPGPGPGPQPPPGPGPVVSVPELLKPAVSALQPFPAPRAALGKFYADFAKVLEFSDPNRLQTMGQVRDALVASLKQFVATGAMGAAPKVGTHIDAYVASQVDLEDGALTADKRAKLVAAFKTVAEVLK